jgi:hypothetical protein
MAHFTGRNETRIYDLFINYYFDRYLASSMHKYHQNLFELPMPVIINSLNIINDDPGETKTKFFMLGIKLDEGHEELGIILDN